VDKKARYNFAEVDITIIVKNNRNYTQTANVLGNPYNLRDTANAITEYKWDLTGFVFTIEYYITLQYRHENEASFSLYTSNLESQTVASVVSSLNLLGIGYFYTFVDLGQTIISTTNDTYVFGDLSILPDAGTTTTTTTTTTEAPTTTTTTTTTTAAPTTTTTTTSTTTEAPTTTTTTTTTTEAPTTTTTTTSTTTEAPTTTTTTTTTTEAPTTTTTTTSTTTEAPTTTTTTTTTTEAPTTTTTTTSTTTEAPTTTTTTTTTTIACDDCYEYTFTANPTATIQWINCNGTSGTQVLSDTTPFVITCAVENSIVIIAGTGNIVQGSLCGNTCTTTTTTTTTTAIP